VALTPATPIRPEPLSGHWVRLAPVQPVADADALFRASHDPRVPGLWDYMGVGPFDSPESLSAWLKTGRSDPMFFAITAADQTEPQGVAAYMRIKPVMATVEIGHIWFGHDLRQTRAASEAIFLLIEHAFAAGYRRVEWKCDADNAASRKAADRFGFRFEGIFAQHMIIKGRNRDTAWFALLDGQWPRIRQGFQRWLAPENFTATGNQLQPLGYFLR
jgi:RimJ/RimL family protein N-acetyltransferase